MKPSRRIPIILLGAAAAAVVGVFAVRVSLRRTTAPPSRPWPHLEVEAMKAFQVDLAEELPLVRRVMSDLVVDPRLWNWDSFLAEATVEWGRDTIQAADLVKAKALFDLWRERCAAAWQVYSRSLDQAIAERTDRGEGRVPAAAGDEAPNFRVFAGGSVGDLVFQFQQETDPELFRLSCIGVYFAHQTVKEMRDFFMKTEKP